MVDNTLFERYNLIKKRTRYQIKMQDLVEKSGENYKKYMNIKYDMKNIHLQL